jgi:hypothetical protein
VAVSADGKRWFLVNASPDLRAQIEAFPGKGREKLAVACARHHQNAICSLGNGCRKNVMLLVATLV